MSSQPLVVSAPGKVLFAGGFLVLDREYTGLVFGLNARIHVHIQSWQPDESLKDQELAIPYILVQSPQFRDAKWLYQVQNLSTADQKESVVDVAQITSNAGYSKGQNKFVETTLRYTLTYLYRRLENDKSTISQSTKLTILADDDYYSQSQTASKRRSEHTERLSFTDFGCELSKAHKTGLGSSAALSTALVAALLSFHSLQVPSLSLEKLNQIHSLAQAAHCAAQGKVGSGFDIAAAVFGSCLYRRFSPDILGRIGEFGSTGFGRRLHDCVDDCLEPNQKWDTEIMTNNTVEIPNALLLVMCDVDCGSETPGMVRQVLQWRKDNPEEAKLLWRALQRKTEELCTILRQLSIENKIHREEWHKLGDIIRENRRLVREMSTKSNVPVEPPVITKLLDYCTDLPGVVGGVAPGAGGYDAVALLIKNDIEVLRDLEDRLGTWQTSENTTGPTIGNVRLLGVKQAKEGVRYEDVQKYDEWV